MAAKESPVITIKTCDGAPLPVSGTFAFQGATAAQVIEVPLPVAGTAVTQALPSNARSFTMKARDGKLSVAYTGAGPFQEIAAGGTFSQDGIGPSLAATLHLKSSKPNDLVTIQVWTA